MIELEYLLPLKTGPDGATSELAHYVRGLAQHVDVTVVDGSDPRAFARNGQLFGSAVRHVPPDPALRCANGKVAGVVTGLRSARHDKVIIADDDVRYATAQLVELARLLDTAALIRPQNYFDELPWHARWDTARTLLNRAFGGDYPGTLALRVTPRLRACGYDGDVLFENLELIRTVKALGGSERIALDCYVARRPPPTGHFWNQRLRQAYDSNAQPLRLVAELAIIPTAMALYRARRARWARTSMAALVGAVVGTAEYGRRRAGGAGVFPADAVLWAGPWLLERGCCVWCAVLLRWSGRGVRYGTGRLVRAATPQRELDRRLCSRP